MVYCHIKFFLSYHGDYRNKNLKNILTNLLYFYEELLPSEILELRNISLKIKEFELNRFMRKFDEIFKDKFMHALNIYDYVIILIQLKLVYISLAHP